VLVPAVMHTLGRANWRLPAILDRRLPHLNLEDSAEIAHAGVDASERTGEFRATTRT
jgi:putative drug exporter of the RND superfamily